MNTFANKENRERLQPRVRSSERECPQCDGVLVENEKEECFECVDCGHIDCSHANELLPLAKVV